MTEQTTNIDQPQERVAKKILVACHCEGRQVWALLEARKDGRKYRVNPLALAEMQLAARNGDTSKRVFWG